MALSLTVVHTPATEHPLPKQIPDTAKARGLTEEQVIRDVLLQAQPTRRFVTVGSSSGELAAFLCTDAAASITGAALPVEGGWIVQMLVRWSAAGGRYRGRARAHHRDLSALSRPVRCHDARVIRASEIRT